jgi:osmotically-inducible protein OsmY
MAIRVACCLLLLVLTLPAAAQSKGTEDDRIYDEVRKVLTFDADVRGGAIDVVVTDGAVVLQGRVRDKKAREKAPKLAKKVKGVKTVDNQLKLFGEK